MSKTSKVFYSGLGGATGISPYTERIERRLSDLSSYFQNKEVVKDMLCKGNDPEIYETYEIPQPAVEGLLNVGCTIVYPGKIANEYYFTRGHIHQKETTSEVYLGLEGEGIVLIQSCSNEVTSVAIKPSILVYIPPNTAHRTVNTGSERLVFLAVYPSDAGHEYESIERTGFARIVVEDDGRPVIEDNPEYSKC